MDAEGLDALAHYLADCSDPENEISKSYCARTKKYFSIRYGMIYPQVTSMINLLSVIWRLVDLTHATANSPEQAETSRQVMHYAEIESDLGKSVQRAFAKQAGR